MTCQLCHGEPWSAEIGDRIAYVRTPSGFGKCPRCKGSGLDAGRIRLLHPGLVLENVRSGKRWVIYHHYERWPDGREWGVHRFKPAKHGGRYVWQIKLLTLDTLMNPQRWREVGFGDAWDHALMQTDPL